MQHIHRYSYMASDRPALFGIVRGGAGNENVHGTASVFWLPDAFYFEIQMYGLPKSEVFGLHIHDGLVCGSEDGFAAAGGHFSVCPDGTWCNRHPYHAGDLPPVFSDENGEAVFAVYIDKATVSEISGKPIVLHGGLDDFSTQPSGNSGMRIACGILAENL